MGSSAAKKAWATRRKGKGKQPGTRFKRELTKTEIRQLRDAKALKQLLKDMSPEQLQQVKATMQEEIAKEVRSRGIRSIPLTEKKAKLYKQQFWVPSSTGEKDYKVSERIDGIWMCDCPQYRFQKGKIESRKPCKHIQMARGDRTPYTATMPKVTRVSVDVTQTKGPADLERSMKAQEMLTKLHRREDKADDKEARKHAVGRSLTPAQKAWKTRKKRYGRTGKK
jgi:hypothetical protein